jgi:hypothetical protein
MNGCDRATDAVGAASGLAEDAPLLDEADALGIALHEEAALDLLLGDLQES